MEAILVVLFTLALLIAPHYLLRRVVRRLGPKIIRPAIRPLRPILTFYYRRKVIRQIQAERKAQGLPPLDIRYLS